MRNRFCNTLCAFAVLLSFIASLLPGSAAAYADDSSETAAADSSAAGTSIDGTAYFYNQFSNSSHRIIYKQILEAAQTFHDSDDNATYNDGGYYSAFELSVDNKDWSVVGSTGMEQIINAVIADHPEFFWLSDNYVCQQKTSGELSYTALTIECYSLYANGKTRQIYRNNIDMAIKEYAASIPDKAKDYEKVYLIHNAIINKVYYASDVTSCTGDDVYAYTIDGVFSSKYLSAVTYGYAKAFKAVMDYVGVPCLYIEGQNSDLLIEDSTSNTETGESNGDLVNNCAWNAVYLDGDWYLVNPGLDDPVTSTGKEALSYDYFNITDEKASNLTAITDRLPGIPACSGTEYNLERVQTDLESDGLWESSNYSFMDRLLDKYGLSVVLISIGAILLLIVAFIKNMHKKGKQRRTEKVKNTKTTVVDHTELDDELRKPPIS